MKGADEAHGMKKKRRPPAKLCGAKLVDGSGRTCGQPAGWGTGTGRGRCKKHGGCTPTHMKKAEREAALEAVEIFGLPREIEPTDALLEEVHRTAGWLHFLDLKIRGAGSEEAVDPVILGWYRAERRHMVLVCRAAIAAGIAERQVQIAEHQAAIFATALRGIVEDLGVADHPKLGKIVRKHLTLIEGGKAA